MLAVAIALTVAFAQAGHTAKSDAAPATGTAAASSAVSAPGSASAPAVGRYPANLYVSPFGADSASGTTLLDPLKTIQAALNVAGPGSTIHLAPGDYHEDPVTKTAGTAGEPITILGTGPPAGTVLYGTDRVFSINNSYYHLEGFTISGEVALAGMTMPSALRAVAAFKAGIQHEVVGSKLVYIGAADTARDVEGVVLRDMVLMDAGGECVRMRNDAHHDQVIDSTIEWCGLQSVKDGSAVFAYHNGEGVYVGTSPQSTTEPMYADDDSSDNTIEGDVIRTYGSECFDVKENAHDNVFSHNTCSDNAEPLSYGGSNVELRGYDNQVVDNVIAGSLGYGLKLASDSTHDRQGGNVVEGNTFSGDSGPNVDNEQSSAQGMFCGNTFPRHTFLTGSTVGDATAPCGSE